MKNIINFYFRERKRKENGFNSILYSSAASFIQSNIYLYVCLDLSSKNENTQSKIDLF